MPLKSLFKTGLEHNEFGLANRFCLPGVPTCRKRSLFVRNRTPWRVVCAGFSKDRHEQNRCCLGERQCINRNWYCLKSENRLKLDKDIHILFECGDKGVRLQPRVRRESHLIAADDGQAERSRALASAQRLAEDDAVAGQNQKRAVRRHVVVLRESGAQVSP